MKPDASDQEMAELVLGFYKSSRFSKNSCVRVTHGQAIDSGGVRRQLFSSAFNAIADGHLQIFLKVLQLEPLSHVTLYHDFWRILEKQLHTT